MNEIEKKLEEIFRDIFDDEDIVLTEKTNAEDIQGWDSLTHISILAAIQDEFGISFGMDEIISMKNVGDILNAIEEKRNE